MSINTFAEVAKHYANTRPIVSCNHTKEQDIRPLGKRERKWERIECVNRNKYILHDVLPQRYVNPPWAWETPYSTRPPIVWEKRNGREQVTVRAAVRSGGDTSRYNFLRAWLPLGLKFDNWTRVGSHYIETGANRYYLPRPEEQGDERDYFLKFERFFGKFGVDELDGIYSPPWKLISREYKVPRVRVNKKKKAAAKEHIASFYEWLCAIGPVLPVKDWDYHRKLRGEIIEYLEDPFERNRLYEGDNHAHHGGRTIPPILVLEIMKNSPCL